MLRWCLQELRFSVGIEANPVQVGAMGFEAAGFTEVKRLFLVEIRTLPLNAEAIRIDSG